jgi:hypothetical protein
LATDPPHPATLGSYPRLEAPLFDAALRTDHVFTMSIHFPTVFDAFATYGYRWDRIRVPDNEVISSSRAAETEGDQPSWSEVYGARLARDRRYIAADVDRAIRHFGELFGPPGPMVQAAAINGLMRYVGTSIRTFFQIITEPRSQSHYVFPSEGLYIVRCRATPSPSEYAEVTRPPSVAYLPVFARDPELMAETRTVRALDEQRRAQARRDEIRSRLGDPDADLPNRTRLQEELNALEASLGTTQQALVYQRTQLTGRLNAPGVSAREQARIRRQIQQINEILDMRRGRGLTGAERLIATFVSDRGQVIRLALEAVNRTTEGSSTHTYYVSDATTPNSGDAERSGANRAEAIIAAVRAILESGMGYGRGVCSVLIDGRAHSLRIEAASDALLMEALENVATIASIAAIAAAPFTGGSSLYLLLPIGIIGAIPSAYRLASRAEANNLRWDMNTAMDIVNIVGGVAGVAQVGVSTRAIWLGRALMITGVGSDGAGVLLMGGQVMNQVAALDEMPPGMRAAQLLEIVGNAMLNAGIMIGGSLASRAHLRQTEASLAHAEHSYTEWRRGLNEETRRALDPEANPRAVEVFSSMRSDVRQLLTLCRSVCIPIDPPPTQAQAQRIQDLLDQRSPSPDDRRWMQAYFHENRANLSQAISTLEGTADLAAMRTHLQSQLDVIDVVLLPWSATNRQVRGNPHVRARVQDLINFGVPMHQLAAIMDHTRARGTGGQNMIRYLENMVLRPGGAVPGYQGVLADLAQGYNFFTGAEWVLRYIDGRPNGWSTLQALEVTGQGGSRRWDARMFGQLLEFKSWSAFRDADFVRQIIEDYNQTAGFTSQYVYWVFETRIGTATQVRQWAHAALDAALQRGHPGLTQTMVTNIQRILNQFIIVP